MTGHELHFAIGCDKGNVRQNNEDAVGYRYPTDWHLLERYGVLFVVADGVGGLNDGELASDFTVRTLIERYYSSPLRGLPEDHLRECIQQINAEVHQKYAPTGSTLTVALFHQHTLIIAHVGDSRLYWQHLNAFKQVTTDHTVPIVQPNGKTKHKLMRAIGHQPSLTVDIYTQPFFPQDKVLLCSDGLTRYLSDSELENALNSGDDAKKVVLDCIQSANERGGIDNISVIIVEVGQPIEESAHLQRYHKQRERLSPFVTVQEALPVPVAPVAPQLQDTPPPAPSVLPPSTRRTPRGAWVALVGLLVGGVALWGGMTLSTTAPLTATAPANTPILATEPLLMPTPSPEVTALDTTMTLIFSQSTSTVVQIGERVTAFIIEVGERYTIRDIYTDSSTGTRWIRLYDTRSETYGWIDAKDLPLYRVVD